jgi:hypothetical protein
MPRNLFVLSQGDKEALASYRAVERYIQVHGAGSESIFRDAERLASSCLDGGPPDSEVRDIGAYDSGVYDGDEYGCEAHDCGVFNCKVYDC